MVVFGRFLDEGGSWGLCVDEEDEDELRAYAAATPS